MEIYPPFFVQRPFLMPIDVLMDCRPGKVIYYEYPDSIVWIGDYREWLEPIEDEN